MPVKTTRTSNIVIQNPKINLAISNGLNVIAPSCGFTVAVAVDVAVDVAILFLFTLVYASSD